MWANGEGELTDLCHTFVHLDASSRVQPNPESAVEYERVYASYLEKLNAYL